MTAGFTPLLKFGEGGKPGFRPFQLSSDLMALTWQSKNKAANKTKGQEGTETCEAEEHGCERSDRIECSISRRWRRAHCCSLPAAYAASASAAALSVYIKDMKEIRYGQRTDKFKKNNRPDLENLSFSVMYGAFSHS